MVDHKNINTKDFNIFNRWSILLERGNVTVLIWNARSLNMYTIRCFLSNLLHSNAIDLAIIQEMWLMTEDKLYIMGYKLYRSDKTLRRKGTLIMVRANINVKIVKILSDV